MEAETSFVAIGLLLSLGSIVATGLLGYFGTKERAARLSLLEQDARQMIAEMAREQRATGHAAKKGSQRPV
jgi:type II secretory pathway pseudopilin PulG